MASGEMQTMWDPLMLEAWASDNAEMAVKFLLKDGAQQTCVRLLNSLEEGSDQGEDVRRLADRVQAILQGDREQAFSIAQNVLGAVLAERQYTSALSAGMKNKIWCCPPSPARELGGHRDAERRYRKHPCPIDEPFTVNGARLRFPRDYTTGHPEECVGCNCLAIAKRV
jgi:hypothetical protein